ncbi:MAG: 50S ribosomal protein L32 [Lentisphaerae bacterium]|nr:50S ribosomal protein L32 [Lentisphaerota bacterium]
MAVPKRKKSKMRIRMRRAHKKAEISETTLCPECNSVKQTHRACKNCGMYKSRQVLTIDIEE